MTNANNDDVLLGSSEMRCDRCGGEFALVSGDSEYRHGCTVQVGEFSVRAGDTDGDSYDEPDNDQRWFCGACWEAIKADFFRAYHSSTQRRYRRRCSNLEADPLCDNCGRPASEHSGGSDDFSHCPKA